MSDFLFGKERKLPNELKKRINNYAYPSKEQIEDWRINHFLDGYWKCLEDIKDIIIEVDGNTFSNEDFRHIQNLGGIIGHDEQLKEEKLPCEFGLGGLKITINNTETYEKDLINLKK